MGVRNFLIEGVSGTGKTTLCDELLRRGCDAIHGDRVLAYQGDPLTGLPLDGSEHAHHVRDVDKVRSLIAKHDHAMTFFCGGSRNFGHFIDLFDIVFVLDVDAATLHRRLATRPRGEFGGTDGQRAFIARLHETGRDVPRQAVRIDATRTPAHVADEILSQCAQTA